MTRFAIAMWLAIVAMLGIGVGVTYKLRTTPPPPPPVIVEWVVDKEFGDKKVTLPNGLHLVVYKEEEGTSTEWGWTVGAPAQNEREAMDKALHMGGVK